MKRSIKKYIAFCKQCNENKHARHKLYEKMKTLKISKKTGQNIVMNFIIKLSKFMKFMTKILYDVILVIPNKLIKYEYFISYKKSFTIENLIYKIYQMIVTQHELFEKIISNRDKLFISKFGKTLMKLVEIKHKLFTTYYSQTNEQIKRLNQTLK